MSIYAMNTISYKGYLGTVNFEGESVHELTEAFHEAIEIIKGS